MNPVQLPVPEAVTRVLGFTCGWRRFRRSMLVAGGQPDVWVRCPFYFWAVRLEPVPPGAPLSGYAPGKGGGAVPGEGRWVLVDTGIRDGEMAGYNQVTSYIPTRELLKSGGVNPAQISHVIITHLHWDHAGGLSAILGEGSGGPVTVWLSALELDWARGLFSHSGAGAGGRQGVDEGEREEGEKVGPPMVQSGVHDQDLELIQRLYGRGQIQLINPGALPIGVAVAPTHTPSIMALASPGHTPGSISVVVRPHSGPGFLFTSDGAYLSENLLQQIPPGVTFAPEQARETISRLADFSLPNNQKTVFIPGHDPEVVASYPPVGPGVFRLYPP